MEEIGGEAVLLVDPAAGLVDPQLIDGVIQHASENLDIDFFFTPAAPGLSGVLLRKTMITQLATATGHPGTLLSYRPDIPQRDPISMPSCAPLPTVLARTMHRFTLDSARQIERLSLATEHLNGELIGTAAERLHHSIGSAPAWSMPREVVLELTTRRNTKPVFSPISQVKIDRPDLSMETAKKIVDELSGVDDLRLVLAGVGDPLLHGDLFDFLGRFASKGISIAIETDLFGLENPVLDWLADSPVDIVSIFIPAASAQTYQVMMGVDGMRSVLDNLRRLIDRRQNRRSGTPLFVPTFIKSKINLAEMEPWYDHWLRVLGCAVISGPSDFSGRIPDISAARMEPPLRKPCARLAGRLTILSDGKIVSCEQDFLGEQAMGTIGQTSIRDAWNGLFAKMRNDHKSGNWKEMPVCGNCSDWHRP
jgi:MoaA/NifB/PqqE/SkfB family radical SAM enzyme